jgi:hypothetical protein
MRMPPVMPMPRPQFTLRALLVAMLVVAVFFGGMAVQRHLDKPVTVERKLKPSVGWPTVWNWEETMVLPDGTTWQRQVDSPSAD